MWQQCGGGLTGDTRQIRAFKRIKSASSPIISVRAPSVPSVSTTTMEFVYSSTTPDESGSPNRNSILAMPQHRGEKRPDGGFHSEDITPSETDELIRAAWGKYSIWPHPVNENDYPRIHQESETEGALYCSQYEEELAKVEPIVEEYHKVGLPWAGLMRYSIGHFPCGQPPLEKKLSRIRWVEGLDKYFKLLLRISVECAAKETRQTLTLEKAQDIDLDTAYMEVRPWNQLEILCDESVPLLSIRHPKMNFDERYPKTSDADPALRLEMACNMEHHSLTHYQGLIIDGLKATLRFVQVPGIDSISADRKSRVDFARYRFPRDRNGFICHMVNLLNNSDDYEKYFKYKTPAYEVPLPRHPIESR